MLTTDTKPWDAIVDVTVGGNLVTGDRGWRQSAAPAFAQSSTKGLLARKRPTLAKETATPRAIRCSPAKLVR
ncbi:hypothetical protein [Jiangella sp. DSM 45060]|uniref:hypothetical protein n=1 Tax=Jiangella sp. DSM 45060 TaxID=1798224 RepID=UPI0012FD1077|nr:hypothetical protein [Jiangella sp. DSM 45060]